MCKFLDDTTLSESDNVNYLKAVSFRSVDDLICFIKYIKN